VLQSRVVAHAAEDDGFHEIQLNGKQLVFLVMAATVVSVVIFLCGVLVGRGVRADRAETLADAAGAPVAAPDTPASRGPVSAPAGSDPTAAAAPPAVDELSYFDRLDKKNQPADDLKVGSKAPATPAPPPVAVERPARKEPAAIEKSGSAGVTAPPSPVSTVAAKQPAATDSVAASTEPAGNGFALQVTALRERGEAEAIAKRLSSRGYAAYVMKPAAGAPSVYRVRVGKFKTRHEAEAVATKLQKEEQFTPWITR
jgi:cell division septation protein DedD